MIALSKALKLSLFYKYVFDVNPYGKFYSNKVWNSFKINSPRPSTLVSRYFLGQTKRSLISKRKKTKKKIDKTGPLLIVCKRKKFNHYLSMRYNELKEIPLASKTWRKRKSNGDYFSILPTSKNPAFIYPEEMGCRPHSFKSLGICEGFLQRLEKIGIQNPTFVQYAAIPRIKAGEHVLLSAEAGSGKTLAYVLPMLENILKWKSKMNMDYNSPLGIIVVPTRELALQVEKVVKSLSEGLNIHCEVLLSNYTKSFLLNIDSNFIKYVDVAVCTLGIISKLTHFRVYSLSHCLNLVLDEADMLLDDTFIKDARALFSRVNFNFDKDVDSSFPKGAQLSLVSATIPYEIHESLNEVFPSHLLQNITTRYLHRTLPHITHKFIRCSKLVKKKKVLTMVKGFIEKNEPVIIFSNETKTCNWLAHFFRENNIESARCNSHMSYNERVSDLEKFQKGKVKVITCTDLLSRGQNIIQIQHVINYEFPKFISDYIHRSGRTGRIGISEERQNKCNVINFISSEREALLVNEIELSVRRNNTLPHVNNNIARLISHRNRDRFKKRLKVK